MDIKKLINLKSEDSMEKIIVNNNLFEVQVIDTEAVFQNKEDGSVHFLNETAFLVFNQLTEKIPLESIVEMLCERYNAPFDQVLNDCKNVVEEMRAVNIIAVVEE